MKKYFHTKCCTGFTAYPIVVLNNGRASALNQRGVNVDLLNYTSADLLERAWIVPYQWREVSEVEAMQILGRTAPKRDTRQNYLNQRRVKGRFAPSKPQELRKGSLYKAETTDGKQIVGRYRNDAFGSYLVFSEHKNPVIVKANTVQFADTREVNTYLGK